MIDLARKDNYPILSALKDMKNKKSYPMLSISYPDKTEFPKGEFMAMVKLNKTSCTESTDENGVKRCTATFDVMGIEPGECCDSSEADDMGEEDIGEDMGMGDGDGPHGAADSIMISMKIANRKKMMNQED